MFYFLFFTVQNYRCFCYSEIKDALNLSKRFNETSGYLTFEKNQSRRAIKIEIINDLIPQRRMNYVVRLADVGDDRNEIEEKAVISEHQGVLNITGSKTFVQSPCHLSFVFSIFKSI